LIKMLEGYWGHETSDPAKVAQVILRLATEEQLPAHLLPGSDAVQYAQSAEVKREADGAMLACQPMQRVQRGMPI
jgi:hypothetical protein